jgi:hypothetical protein
LLRRRVIASPSQELSSKPRRSRASGLSAACQQPLVGVGLFAGRAWPAAAGRPRRALPHRPAGTHLGGELSGLRVDLHAGSLRRTEHHCHRAKVPNASRHACFAKV